MRSLANEAHADLKAQLAAAGVAVASDDEAMGVHRAAAVDTGGGGVRALSSGGAARGDAVIVDPTAWSALVRDAYRSYNAAIVAAIVKARPKG